MALELRKDLLIEKHANYIAEISKVSALDSTTSMHCLVTSSNICILLPTAPLWLYIAPDVAEQDEL